MGEDVGAEATHPERSDHPGRAAGLPGLVGEGHAVDGERGLRVGAEHSFFLPAPERRGGAVVGVGKDQAHRIVRVARQERAAFFRLDDVVGWCADRVEPAVALASLHVADSSEGKKLGHRRRSFVG